MGNKHSAQRGSTSSSSTISHSNQSSNSTRPRGSKVVDTHVGSTFNSASTKLVDNPNSNSNARVTTPKSPTRTAAPISTTATTKTPLPNTTFHDKKCQAWFKTYTGLEDDEDMDAEQIGPNGIAKLCDDIGVSLAAVDMLVLAYHLHADTMPIFTKDEWMKGMETLEVDSSEKLRQLMPKLVAKLKEPKEFKEFYRYIFMFAKDSDQKCMLVDTATGMLETVLEGRAHVKAFLEFLEAKKPVKVINKDQWYSFLEFSDSIAEDLSNYDGINSAWPVLLDEYVEWRNESSD